MTCSANSHDDWCSQSSQASWTQGHHVQLAHGVLDSSQRPLSRTITTWDYIYRFMLTSCTKFHLLGLRIRSLQTSSVSEATTGSARCLLSWNSCLLAIPKTSTPKTNRNPPCGQDFNIFQPTSGCDQLPGGGPAGGGGPGATSSGWRTKARRPLKKIDQIKTGLPCPWPSIRMTSPSWFKLDLKMHQHECNGTVRVATSANRIWGSCCHQQEVSAFGTAWWWASGVPYPHHPGW